MKNKLLLKGLAMALVITLTFANVMILETFVQEVYAAKEDKIVFSAHIENKQEKAITQIDSQEANNINLCLNLSLEEGYLENAQITLKDANFKLINLDKEIDQINSVDIENQIIYLNEINKETKEFKIPVEINKDDVYDISNISKESELVLEGSYMSEDGKTKNVSKKAKLELSLMANADILISQEISKVIPFDSQDEKGLLIESIVKTSLEQNALPVKETTLNIEAPKINGQKPQKVQVYANSTKATNGKSFESFDSQSYKFDGNSIEINVENMQDENGKVNWLKNVQDEYVITYIYSDEVQKLIQGQKVAIEQKINASMKTYTNQGINQESKQSFEISESKGKIVSTQIGANTAKISKGYLYTKSEQETLYNMYFVVDVAYSQLVDEIKIVAEQEKLLNKDKEELAIKNETYFKQIAVSKDNFNKILGENGEIILQDKQEQEIAKINNETEEIDGKYTINFETQLQDIVIKTTKPQTEGKLQIETLKSIKLGESTTKEQIQEMKSMKFSVDTVATKKVEKKVEKTNQAPNQEEKANTGTTIKLTPVDGDVSITEQTSTKVVDGVGETTTSITQEINGETTTTTTTEKIGEDSKREQTTTTNNNSQANNEQANNEQEQEKDKDKENNNNQTSSQELPNKQETTTSTETPKTPETITETVTQTVETSKDVQTGEIEIVEPIMQIGASINNNLLTTVQKNTGVEFRVTLKTNNDTCALYENPQIIIELPSYVKDITNIEKEIFFDFDRELKIKNVSTSNSDNGNKLIIVDIEGTQTKNITNEQIEGAVISVIADIELSEIAATKEDKAIIHVINGDKDEVVEEQKLDIVAPVGLATITTITVNGNEAVSISGQEGAGKLDVKSEAQSATIKMTIINNYKNKLENLQILGRTPFAGNKKVTSNEELGSTFTANLTSKISAVTGINEENIEVYYSENGEADKDLAKASNGWTKEPQDLSKIKSYTIVIKNYTMNTGDRLEFKYDVQIPNNLNYDAASYSTFAVYFNNVTQQYTIQDMQEATKVGAQTKETSNLKVDLKASVANGEKVQEGQIIKYTITVTNQGKETVENVFIRGDIPEGTTYVTLNKKGYYEETTPNKYYKIYTTKIVNGETTIEQKNQSAYLKSVSYIKPQESVQVEYEVKVNVAETDKITNIANASYLESDREYKSSEITNEVVEGYIELEMRAEPAITKELSEGDVLTYILNVKNINTNKKGNIVVTSPIPNGTTYESATNNGNYNSKTNKVTWQIGDLTTLQTKTVSLSVKVNNLVDKEYEKTIENVMTATCNETNNAIKSNQLANKVTKAAIDIYQNCDIEEEKVSPGDVLTYTYKFTNIGTKTITSLKFENYMPEGLTYISGTYTQNSKKYDVYSINGDKKGMEISPMQPKETITVEIKARVNKVDNDTELTNYAVITAPMIDTVESNKITHVVENSSNNSNNGGNNNGNNNNNNGSQQETYKIAGTVWLDENGDGERTENEATLSNVQVLLLSSKGELLQTQTTSSNGTYSFNGLVNDEYLVAFIYNSKLYTVTSYQKDKVTESRNSDATSMNFQLDGEIKQGAMTNKLAIIDTNLYNIDLGLVEANKFDLKLAKTVSKITVQTSKDTKTYNYKGDTMTKIDINPNYINGANVVIEYKIAVTNEGKVPGYVKKIVDYIPDDLKFVSDLNNDWYLAENGNAYNSTLANQIINPEETKEVTITLTKTMTEENLGLVRNIAEIYEAYNDLGIQDMDSTPANSKQGEDDMGTANTVLSLNTGETAVYATITIAMIAIFAVGAYFIKKKVLNKI